MRPEGPIPAALRVSVLQTLLNAIGAGFPDLTVGATSCRPSRPPGRSRTLPPTRLLKSNHRLDQFIRPVAEDIAGGQYKFGFGALALLRGFRHGNAAADDADAD